MAGIDSKRNSLEQCEMIDGSVADSESPKQPRPREIRLLCPLSIKFSQPRCRPNFQDGRTVESAVALVAAAPFPEAWATPPEDLDDESSEDSDGGDSTPGGKQTKEHVQSLIQAPEDEYDELLVHPFPCIEVIRWRAKLRDEDGNVIQDTTTGKDKMGDEEWFTLDNRRLCALQQAAVKHWPKRCAIVVKVLRGDFGHALRKFKTLTNGRCVEIGHRFDESNTNSAWAWEAAVECLPGSIDFTAEEKAFDQVKKDEGRVNDCACLFVGGCARVKPEKYYTDEQKVLLRATIAEKKTISKEEKPQQPQKQQQSSDGRGYPPPGLRVNGNTNADTLPPWHKKKAPVNVNRASPTAPEKTKAPLSMADKVAALARERSGNAASDLISLMRSKDSKPKQPPRALEEESTSASDGANSPKPASRDVWHKNCSGPTADLVAICSDAAVSQRNQQRKPRGRSGRGGGNGYRA